MIKQRHSHWPAVLIAAAVVVALVAAPVLAEQKFEEKFAKTAPLSKSGKLYLTNISGDIEILTSKEAQVKIEALKTSKASSLEKAKENAAKVTIEVTERGRSRPGRDEIPQEERRILGRRLHQRHRRLQDLGPRAGRGRDQVRQRRR